MSILTCFINCATRRLPIKMHSTAVNVRCSVILNKEITNQIWMLKAYIRVDRAGYILQPDND